MERSKLSLVYSGPAVDAGEMDAYEAGASIMAFGDFLGVVSKAAYGDNAQAKTTVRAVHPGSFEIEFAIHAAGIASTVFSAGYGPKEILDLIKQSFALWKFLKGERPKEFRIEGDKLTVQNNFGTIQYFRIETGKIVTDEKAGEAVERFVRKNLERGINQVRISQDKQPIAEAQKEDAKSFGIVPVEQPLTDSLVRIGLILESPVFKEGNKWKFSDGQASFLASIEDRDFLSRVETGELRFGQGDMLVVEMQLTQMRTLAAIKTERRILKVLEHRTVKQERLF